MDLEGRIAAWNVGAERMLGYSEAEALGRSAAMIFPADQAAGTLAREIREATNSGRAMDDGWHIRKDGTRFWGSGILAPVHNSSGEIAGFVKVLRDESVRNISDEERAELLGREQTARQEAEHAIELKDRFLATLSHELRTPLSSILMWAQMLVDKKIREDEREEGLRVIVRSAEAQRQLLDDLLDTSRIASGKVSLNVSRVELAPLVHAAIEAIRPLADEKQVKIEPVLVDERIQLHLDPNRIRQVLNNLLTNAIKFTPSGGQVTVATLRYEDGVEIRVTDTGIGIEPSFLPHVFTAFSQGDYKSNRAFGGLGLGLAIAKQFVEMHGGTIVAKSAGRNHGATFIVRLPHGIPVADSKETEQTNNTTGPTDMDLNGVSVLLVEDDRGSRDALIRYLLSEGVRVRSANSADAALSEFQQERPDVIISDIGLPGKDGYEFMQQLRTWETEQKLEPTPALALTAFAGRDDSRKAREAGYQQHLAKPIDAEQVVQAIAKLAVRQ